ncbi:MAG: YgiT-type zinc finger protein [Cyanobacteria bacterium J06623_5]
MASNWQENLVEKQVTYTLNLNGKIFLIDNVPARVNEETGEQFFSPSTVERLQQTILNRGNLRHPRVAFAREYLLQQ